MKKRILSILLSLAMVLTLTPVSAFAGSQSVTFDVKLNVGSNVTLRKVVAIFPEASNAAITIVKGNVTGNVRTKELNVKGRNVIDGGKVEGLNSVHFAMVAWDTEGAYYYYTNGGEVYYDEDAEENTCKIYSVANQNGKVSNSKWENLGGQWVKAKLFLNVKTGPGGTVTGKGYCEYGGNKEIEAIPYEWYKFDKWSDWETSDEEGTKTPRTVGMLNDGELTASFVAVQAKDNSGNKYTNVTEALKKVTGEGATITTKDSSLTAVTGGSLASGVTLETPKGKFTAKDAAATIDMGSDGAITLKSGKFEVNGEALTGSAGLKAKINNVDKTFTSESGKHFTLGTDGTLTLNAAGKVVVDNKVTFEGKEGDIFKLDVKSDSLTATIPEGATVTAGGVTITGVAPADDGDAATVALGGSTPTLIAGAGKVTGSVTVNAKLSDEKTVAVTVPSGTTAIIDLNALPKAVRDLEAGESVTYGKITYRAVENSIFPLDSSKLTQTGESAEIPASTAASIKLGTDTTDPAYTAPVVNIASTNTSQMTVAKTEEGGTVTVANTDGEFTVGEMTYTAGEANAVFTVGAGGEVAITKLSAKLGTKDYVIGGGSGKKITNTAAGGSEITVTAEEDGDTVVVPQGGKVTIDGVEYENASDSESMTIVVTKKGGNKLTAGAVKLDPNEEIKAGAGNALIRNTCAGIITVKANDPGEGKATVTVKEYGNVTIAGKKYANASNLKAMTIVVGGNGYEITSGSVKLENGEAIKVGTGSVEVTNTNEKTITVDKEGGAVTVPAGGTLTIGAATITDINQKTIFKIADAGTASVDLASSSTVTINDVIYTGGEGGGTLTINANGKVSAVTNEIVIAIDEDVLINGFTYGIVPGTSVTVGKYVYTAPAGCTLGDVTITGRVDGDEAILNPAIVLKEANKQVTVALSTDKDTKTTYTAASANTMFAMAAAGTDTKKIDLLDNSGLSPAPGVNSWLKFTDKETYEINGVTYQAQDVKEENNEVKEAVSYTVTFGEAEVETGKKDEDGNAIKETVSRNTVSVDSGSKVKVTMASKGTISIASGYVGEKQFTSALPFTAMNGNASLIIDNSVTTTPNKISGDDSYLTAIKGEGDTITGYEVRRRSSGGVVVAPSGNVTNSTENKDTGSGAGTSKVETTTAAVTPETKTNTDGTRTTTAAVDKTTASSIVDKAVENKSEEVVINTTTTTNSAVTETAAGSKTEVALPEETVQGLSQKTEAAITIKSDAAEVTLDKEAVQAVAEQAGSTGTVSLVVETVKQDASAVQVDLKLVTSKGDVTDFRGGNVSVTVKLNAALAAKPVVCVYIDGSQLYHKVSGQKNADGTFTFQTNHFSTYAIMAEEEADQVIAEQNEGVEKMVSDLTLKARSVKTAKGNIKVTLTVDSDAIQQIEDLGYTVKYKFYRSTKKAKSYKAKIEGTGKTYTNTSGEKGTKYYYKARVMVYDSQGTLVAKTALTQCKYACRTR